jgi:serine/threonine protein kinase/tetratricopeptide (TPR) repeat protein
VFIMADESDRVRSIFLAAIEQHAPDGWPDFLDEACAHEPALRGRVERLLRAQVQLGTFHEQLKPRRLAILDEPPAEGPGAVVGPYKLLEQIGEGGMGLVFMAEQTEPVRRRVALKVLKPGLDTAQVVARFEAERQALALMDHPNIAKIHDGGATASGRPYFVMELVRGLPVTDYCDQARLSIPERLALFVQVGRAVQHAHQKGVIHRDLKPSNVLVTVVDGQPVPKVIDFGVAKATGGALTDRTLLTGFHQLVGTPLYMSPEQAELSGVDVDTRSDVYALGVLLYELLTGTTPFDAAALRQAGLDEVRRIIREDEPERPSRRVSTLAAERSSTVAERRGVDPRRLGPLMRGELDWVVMKALEKDRNRRYESASAVAADVQRYLNDEPVLACPPSAGYRMRKFVRRNKGPVAASLALAALLVLGIVGTTTGLVWALQAERAATLEKERATAAEAQAKQEAAIARAVTGFLQNDLLAQAAPDKNARDKKVTVEELLGRAAARIPGKFAQQPRVEAEIRQTIGEAYKALGDLPAAQPHLECAWDLGRRVLGEEHPRTLDYMNDLAALYYRQGQLAKAEPLFVRALELHRRVLGEEHRLTLIVMNNLATVYLDQGQFAKAEPLFVKTLEVMRRVLGEEERRTLMAMSNLASLYQRQGQYSKAEPLLVKALEVRRRVFGEEHPDTLDSLSGLATRYLAQGQHAQAEPLLVQVLEVRRRVQGEEHPQTLRAMTDLAWLYTQSGQLDRAEALYTQALGVQRRTRGEEHPETLRTRHRLASLAGERGQWERMAEQYGAILDAQRRVLGEGHRDALLSINNQAYALARLGQLDRAEALFVKTRELQLRALGREDPQTLTTMANLGEVYQKQGRLDEAEAMLRECLALRQKREPNAFLLASTQAPLGRVLALQQKYAEAEPLLLAAYQGLTAHAKTTPGWGTYCRPDTAGWLAELYEAWGKQDQAAEWRKKLPVTKPATPADTTKD